MLNVIDEQFHLAALLAAHLMNYFFNPCLPHMQYYKTFLSPTFCLLHLDQIIKVDIRIKETSVSEICIRKYSICLPALPVLADCFSLPVHPA